MATQALSFFIQQGKSCLNTKKPVPKQASKVEVKEIRKWHGEWDETMQKWGTKVQVAETCGRGMAHGQGDRNAWFQA